MRNIKLYKLLCLIVFLLAIVSTSLSAQELKATAKIDSVVLPIGQQTKMYLEVKQPKDVILDFPIYTDSLFKNIEIIHQSDYDTIPVDENAILLKKEFLLTSFDTGFYAIPPIRIGINAESGGGEVFTNALALKVITFEVDTTQGIFDIKPVEDLPYTFQEMMPWFIGGVVFVALILIFIWLFRRIKRKEPVFSIRKEKRKEPAHVVALRDLDRIKKEKLWQTDRIKLYYTKLTEVIRKYIEERFEVPAMEQTTIEILEELKRVGVEGEAAIENLKQILSTADMVKFAKSNPLPDENDLSMMNAYLFVNQTKVVEVLPLDGKELENTNAKKE